MNSQNLFDTYFENISIISSLFFSNSRFSLELYGDSFNSSSPHVCRESELELACSYPSCHALFVHRNSVVVEDESLSSNVDEDKVLRFVSKNVGTVAHSDSAVCLIPTADTRALLEAGSFGLTAKVLVANDISTAQYFLSWELPAGSFPQRILLCYSPVIELSETDSSAVVFDHKAVETTVAIASDCWPAGAAKWLSGCHPWISDDVLNDVTSSSIYFVPKRISQCCVTAELQKCLLWKLEFIAAEDVLMKSISVEVKIAHQLLLQLIFKHRLTCCCVLQELLIKYALFWCLDEISVADDWREKSVVDYYVCSLKKLHLFLGKRHFPHYFMPDMNILCNCDRSVCDISWLEAAVTDLTAVQQKAEVIRWTLTCVSSDVTCAVACHLKALFAYSVSMSFIQLFQYLHEGAFIDHLIAKHHDMLNQLRSNSLVSHHLYLKPLIAWINSSLGTMYLVKAYTVPSGRCRTKYTEKAELCMLEAVAGNNMHSCTLHLVQLLLQKKCYREANSYVEMLLATADFSATSRQNFTENSINGPLAFSDQLLAVWRHASSHVDIMFSPVEVSVLFPQLESSMQFAFCDKIGYHDSPVAVLKLGFWMQYIGALCYKHGDADTAMKLLADAERSLADSVPQSVGDSNRAHITYFNILAGALQLILPDLFVRSVNRFI